MTLEFAQFLPNAWLSADGVTLSPRIEGQESTKPRKEERPSAPWRFVLTAGAMSIAVSVSTFTVPTESVAMSSMMPTLGPTGSVQRQALSPISAGLIRQIERIRKASSRGGRDRDDGPMPDPNSLSAAVRVAQLLPPVPGDTSIGLDDDGCVFFHFTNGAREAYLTVEPSALHLLTTESGKRSQYLDAIPFRGEALPDKVRARLERNLKA